MEIGVEIISGSGDLVAKELSIVLEREIGHVESYDDLLLIDSSDIVGDITRIILFSRGIKTAYIVPSVFCFSSPKDLYDKTLEIDWTSFFDASMSFAIVPITNTLDRITIGKNVGQGIVDSFLGRLKQRPKVNLSSPDIRIIAKIIDDKCLLGIDLIGFSLNSLDEIISRLAVLTFDIDATKSYSEIYHSGICESVYEILGFVPLKDRITNTTFITLRIIDQEKILRLLTTRWIRENCKVICFEDHPSKTNLRYNIKLLNMSALRYNTTSYVASNLVARFPAKVPHEKAIEGILNTIKSNKTWEKFTVICRNEYINKFANFETEKIVSLNIRGIKSSMLSMVT